MDVDSVIWLVLPMLAMVVLILVAKSFPQSSKKTRIMGLVVAAIIVVIGVIWRLTHGGF